MFSTLPEITVPPINTTPTSSTITRASKRLVAPETTTPALNTQASPSVTTPTPTSTSRTFNTWGGSTPSGFSASGMIKPTATTSTASVTSKATTPTPNVTTPPVSGTNPYGKQNEGETFFEYALRMGIDPGRAGIMVHNLAPGTFRENDFAYTLAKNVDPTFDMTPEQKARYREQQARDIASWGLKYTQQYSPEAGADYMKRTAAQAQSVFADPFANAKTSLNLPNTGTPDTSQSAVTTMPLTSVPQKISSSVPTPAVSITNPMEAKGANSGVTSGGTNTPTPNVDLPTGTSASNFVPGDGKWDFKADPRNIFEYIQRETRTPKWKVPDAEVMPTKINPGGLAAPQSDMISADQILSPELQAFLNKYGMKASYRDARQELAGEGGTVNTIPAGWYVDDWGTYQNHLSDAAKNAPKTVFGYDFIRLNEHDKNNVIDPRYVTWDDNYGWITHKKNYNYDADQSNFERYLPAAIAAIPGLIGGPAAGFAASLAMGVPRVLAGDKDWTSLLPAIASMALPGLGITGPAATLAKGALNYGVSQIRRGG